MEKTFCKYCEKFVGQIKAHIKTKSHKNKVERKILLENNCERGKYVVNNIIVVK